MVLWRESARLGGIGGVDFNVFGNLAELVRKLKLDADIAIFVNLDVVYQLNQNFAGQLFNVLIFHKGYGPATERIAQARAAVAVGGKGL